MTRSETGDAETVENQTVQVRGEMIRLGQLLKYAGVAESGAHAGAIVAEGDVLVDGEVETRRGRQVTPGATVKVLLPDRVVVLAVVSAGPEA